MKQIDYETKNEVALLESYVKKLEEELANKETQLELIETAYQKQQIEFEKILKEKDGNN